MCSKQTLLLQVRVGLVGLDMVLLVMGQELVSFKIVDAALTTHIAASAPEVPPESPTAHGLPAAAITVALTMEDMSMRDMQVRAPSAMSSACGGLTLGRPGICEQCLASGLAPP